MVARPLLNYKVAFVTSGLSDQGKELPFPVFKNLEDAVGYADNITGKDSKIYVVPRALSTIAGLKQYNIGGSR